MKPLQLTRAQWLFLAFAVVVVVPTITFLAIPGEVDLWLIKRFELPTFQKTLGFEVGYVSLPSSSRVARPVFAVTSVTPDGPFWRAGVRPGDIPTGHHGGEAEFLFALSQGKREGVVDLRLVPMSSAVSGDWARRKVMVKLP
jgi:hypothetical protein